MLAVTTHLTSLHESLFKNLSFLSNTSTLNLENKTSTERTIHNSTIQSNYLIYFASFPHKQRFTTLFLKTRLKV